MLLTKTPEITLPKSHEEKGSCFPYNSLFEKGKVTAVSL